MKKVVFITLTVILYCGCVRECPQPTNTDNADNKVISVDIDTTYNNINFDFNI